MDFLADFFTDLVEFESPTNRLPSKMKMWICKSCFQPEILPSLHRELYKSRIVSNRYSIPEFVWIKRWSLFNCETSLFEVIIKVSHPQTRMEIKHFLSIVVLILNISL